MYKINKKFQFPYTKIQYLCILSIFIICIGFSMYHFFPVFFSEDYKFEKFTDELFQKELSESLLSMHYIIAHPEKEGLTRPPAVLGSEDTSLEHTISLCKLYLQKLETFHPQKLSLKNQIVLDILLYHFHNQLSLNDFYLLEEPLGPNLGIQAQLPVLLAEYSFYEKQDIMDYLNLLSDIHSYFESILSLEKKKAEAGCFMNEETLNRIQEQCRSFSSSPDTNYLLELFENKLAASHTLSQQDKEQFIYKHKEIVKNIVIPSYHSLMEGLEQLRKYCSFPQGLCNYEHGRDYYTYLLQTQVGTTDSIVKIEKLLAEKLSKDIKEMNMIIEKNPSLLQQLELDSSLRITKPEYMISSLQDFTQLYFPSIENTSYELYYVHDSLKDFLSPAFYLTPPIDTQKPNIIYLNPAQNYNNLELFTTLAHESFPGHMYQTLYFYNTNPLYIRHLLNYGGYIEGWATYIEPYAYAYAATLSDTSNATELFRLMWLNRSINLCMYSLIDIGIHYNGWSELKTSLFLKALGVTDQEASHEIYLSILETPANYLKYYYGYLCFLKLKSSEKIRCKDQFDLKSFHRKILEIGPAPFHILKKYIVCQE